MEGIHSMEMGIELLRGEGAVSSCFDPLLVLLMEDDFCC